MAWLTDFLLDFLTLSQNVDGLSQVAEHPPDQLKLLHGTLFEQDDKCDYVEQNYKDPIVPSLAIPKGGQDLTPNNALQAAASNKPKELDISDASVPIARIPVTDLPHCPRCKTSLLRPNVVWFGEQLPVRTMDEIDVYLESDKNVDFILVIGTSAKVYPAAGYIEKARMKGAKVCVVNMDAKDAPPGGWKKGDWFFNLDAAEIVSELLRPMIGEIAVPAMKKV